jgi:hypothetical protein
MDPTWIWPKIAPLRRLQWPPGPSDQRPPPGPGHNPLQRRGAAQSRPWPIGPDPARARGVLHGAGALPAGRSRRDELADLVSGAADRRRPAPCDESTATAASTPASRNCSIACWMQNRKASAAASACARRSASPAPAAPPPGATWPTWWPNGPSNRSAPVAAAPTGSAGRVEARIALAAVTGAEVSHDNRRLKPRML